MINLSLDELKLIAESRNVGDYENKSKKDWIKVLRKPKLKIKIDKKKLEEIRKDFYELRHKFSKKEIDKYRKAFYDIKNYRYLSASEIKEVGKNLNELKKSLRFKKFHGDIDSVDYDDLDNYDDNYDFADDDDDEYRKIGSIRRLFKGFDRDYYKSIRTNYGFGGANNNYIEYKSREDRYENLSPEEYLKMIRPYLRDLINNHKPLMELNDEASDDDDSERGELKILLVIQNNFISTKNFEDTCTVYSSSKPVEVFMGSDTSNAIDRLFNTILQRFQQAIETSIKEGGSEFTNESVALLYYNFQKIDIRRAESYIKSPEWLAHKIKKKYLEKLEKIKQADTDFSSHQTDWENFEQKNTFIALNVLFVSHNSEKIKLAYKSRYNNMRKNVLFCCKKLVRNTFFGMVKK